MKRNKLYNKALKLAKANKLELDRNPLKLDVIWLINRKREVVYSSKNIESVIDYLKTLKDIESGCMECLDLIHTRNEAYDWLQEFKKTNKIKIGNFSIECDEGTNLSDSPYMQPLIYWMKHFFNLEDEEDKR